MEARGGPPPLSPPRLFGTWSSLELSLSSDVMSIHTHGHGGAIYFCRQAGQAGCTVLRRGSLVLAVGWLLAVDSSPKIQF